MGTNQISALINSQDMTVLLPWDDSTQEPTATTEIDFDKDRHGVSVDCNAKNAVIHPNAVEIPDDKVNSNCNGNDDQ